MVIRLGDPDDTVAKGTTTSAALISRELPMNFADLASLARDFVAQSFEQRKVPPFKSSIAFARYTVELLD